MLFNTLSFVYFLPIVILLYYVLPHKFRWILLLLASYVFYMAWRVEYIFLIIFSTLIDYYCSLKMETKETKKEKKKFLFLSLFSNLGLLFFFKYCNFFFDSINRLNSNIGLSTEIPMLNYLLPVGISFYTFQTLSYTLDVYYGRQKVEKHLGYFALYVSYFPQLVAGPIERFSRLTPQLKEHHLFTYDNFVKGMRLILYGLFIKMVIADNLSVFVDQIYESPAEYNRLSIALGLIFYSFQIYCDFHGYSTIAIGCALMMGVRIMDNFKTPYLSMNIGEFWQRWHISLSTWFRDYVYFPLGGNKVRYKLWLRNIFVVFIVSGLWHGANWTFVVWGALYGIVYLIEKQINTRFDLINNFKAFSVGHILLSLKTFVFVTLIWVFFRSQNLDQAKELFTALIQNSDSLISLDINPIIGIFFGLFIISDLILYNNRFDRWCDQLSFISRWIIYAILMFSIIIFAGVKDFTFIYFQF